MNCRSFVNSFFEIFAMFQVGQRDPASLPARPGLPRAWLPATISLGKAGREVISHVFTSCSEVFMPAVSNRHDFLHRRHLLLQSALNPLL